MSAFISQYLVASESVLSLEHSGEYMGCRYSVAELGRFRRDPLALDLCQSTGPM